MIEVKRPPASPAVPAGHSGAVRLMEILAVLFAVDGLAPWQRFCPPPLGGFRQFCFRAPVWGGSGSLVGLGAEVFAATFVVLAIARGWTRASRLPQPGIAVATAFVGLGWAKVVLVLADAAKTASQGDRINPVTPAVWIGLAVVVVGSVALLAVVAETRRITRSVAVVALVAAAVAGIGAPYAASGLAWWGGPLSAPISLGGGNGVGATTSPNHPVTLGGVLFVRNDGRTTVTLDSLDAVSPGAGFRVLRTVAIGPPPCVQIGAEDNALGPGRCAHLVRGSRIAPGSELLLAVVAEPTSYGLHRAGWWRVRYHVGPLHFEVFRVDAMTICAPPPGQKHCPGF